MEDLYCSANQAVSAGSSADIFLLTQPLLAVMRGGGIALFKMLIPRFVESNQLDLNATNAALDVNAYFCTSITMMRVEVAIAVK